MVPFYPDTYYHIYNRGNNRDQVFYKPDNYIYFLRKYGHYLNEWLDTYAYCLLHNHFHILAKVKNEEALSLSARKKLNNPKLEDLHTKDRISKAIIEQFRKLFITYVQAINIQEKRVGSLFQKTFKRKVIESDQYFSNVICYIHTNPSLHYSNVSYTDYPYSSYSTCLKNSFTKIKKNEVLDYFNGKEAFIKSHHEFISNKRSFSWMIEDDRITFDI